MVMEGQSLQAKMNFLASTLDADLNLE